MTDQTLEFGACRQSYCVDIPIINDNEVEKDKTFRVTLGRTADLDRRVIINPTRADITIVDDNGMFHSTPGGLVHVHTLINHMLISPSAVRVHMESAVYEVLESDGSIRVCAVIQSPASVTCPVDFFVSVTISTSDDTASMYIPKLYIYMTINCMFVWMHLCLSLTLVMASEHSS